MPAILRSLPTVILVVSATAIAARANAPSSTPLRTAVEGSSFTLLDPRQTGVDFLNRIDNDHPLNRLYASSMCAGGLTVGDVDGNGLPDLYCTSGPDRNALFLQVEPWKFVRAEGADGASSWGTGAAMVDIDQDGDLDIYVCNYASPNQLYVNEAERGQPPRWKECAAAWGLDFSDAGHTPAFADYDADGDPDLYLMTNLLYDERGRPPAEKVVVMAGGRPQIAPEYEPFLQITKIRPDGKGGLVADWDKKGRPDRLLRHDGQKFTDVTAASGMSTAPNMGLSAVWWDCDQDGDPDLYVGCDFDDPDHFYRNDGGGKFTDIVKEAVPHITWFSMGADFGDMNGDAMPDYLIADMFGTDHYKQKTGMGSMSGKYEFLTTSNPRQYMRNAFYLNTGTGLFLEVAQMPRLDRTNWTWAVKLEDLDCDGLTDAYFTNGMSRNFNDSDNTKLAFRTGETEWQRHLRAGTAPLKERNLAFRNRGGLQFEDVSAGWGLDHEGMSFAAAHCDFDRDGDLDLAVVNLDERVFLYRNDVAKGRRLVVALSGTRSEKHGLGATVFLETPAGKQTRQISLNRGYLSSHEALACFGLGAAEAAGRLTVHWPSGHVQTFTDVKAGQTVTVTEPDTVPPAAAAPARPAALFAAAKPGVALRHTEKAFDDYAREPLLPNQMSQLGPGLAAGDLNADGFIDLYLSGPAGQPGQLFLGKGDGTFRYGPLQPFSDDRAAEDLGAIFFDADGDGDADLYVVSGGNECEAGDAVLQDRLYLNDGRGGFSKSANALPAETESGSCVAAADFDRDGDLDLFVGGRQVPGQYPLPGRSLLLKNDGKGRFTEAADTAAPGLSKAGMVTAAAWTDADNDGWLDLALAVEWGSLRLYLNRMGTLNDATEAAGLAPHTGWWSSLLPADPDHDGDIDFVAGNFGTNHKYHASPGHPTRIYYGDFDGTGSAHLVEAEYEKDVLFPVRGRSCSSAAMPFIAGKFKSFDAFARASLQDIYGERLKSGLTLSAVELRSGVFVNDGRAAFAFQPFPVMAQISPVFGTAAADFTGDGLLDLALTHNFYGPQPETGWMDGGLGLVLRGDGKGGFAEMTALESGFIVPRDPRALLCADLDNDGGAELVAARNNDQALAFRPTVKPAEQLCVSLKQPGPNAAAIGARLTVKCEGRPPQTAEISSAAGCLTAPVPEVFFTVPAGRTASLEIRWPDGKSTRHELSGKGRVSVPRPAP